MVNIDYRVRHSKHVERKIFIEALHHLRNADYDISNYTYAGFGAPYYLDFIFFHRYLSIDKMLCYEKKQELEKRMRFNKPLSCIELKMGSFSSYITDINPEKKYLIWLDYESTLYDDEDDILNDVGTLAGILREGSILIVTVNAQEPCLRNRDEVFSKCKGRFGDYVFPLRKSSLTPIELPKLYVRILRAKIEEGLESRKKVRLFQLFNYLYKDGAKMLTFGGILDKNTQTTSARIKNSLKNLKYINSLLTPKNIAFPTLTLKEKQWLDTHEADVIARTRRVEFGIPSNEVKAYFEFSRHYPQFHEVFV